MPRYKRTVSIVRILMVRDGKLPYRPHQITGSQDAAKLVTSYLAGADREYFVVLLLDAKNKINAINTVATGTLNQALVHPREVFKPAILANAASMILAHNHPSGDPSPSLEDIEVTLKLVEAGRLLGIEVLDHIVLGDETYVSFKDKDMM